MNKTLNYMQVVKQTDKEKLKMYMKCKKKELAKMLIEANKLLPKISPIRLWDE